jgi:hypothetical protein
MIDYRTTCHCGRFLHYSNHSLELVIRNQVDRLGPFVEVTVIGKGSYLVPRHYLALHGIDAASIEKLGFQEILAVYNEEVEKSRV